MKIDKCRSCKAEIIWIKNVNMKFQPYDAKPIKRGVIRGEDRNQMMVMVDTYMPHHATCPDAKKWRK